MAEKKLTGHLERLSYALGLNTGISLHHMRVKSLDWKIFMEAVNATYEGAIPKILPEEANRIIHEFTEEANVNLPETNLFESLEFLNHNGRKDGIVVLESGLQYETLKEGRGAKPGVTDKVNFHFHGTLINGIVFDSSVLREQPVSFPVNGVIPGIMEALQMMRVGSKWRLFVPPYLAFGRTGVPNKIGPNLTLIFELELLGIL